MDKINIFVSSTCYDLAQIRADLKCFIENLGHNPILSEEHDFPIDPNKENIENCINAVKEKADIFILIIGNRYGCTDNGKSITNIEFLTAVEKGIPIYTFTLKSMLSILPVWNDNKNGNYSSIVDNPQIFQFIQDVRKNSGLWNFEFEKAQNIMEILKVQLSYIFNSALQIRQKFKMLNKDDLVNKISNKSIHILLEKKDLYETNFFFQCLFDEVEKYKELRNDYEYSIVTVSSHRIDNYNEYLSWATIKFEQLSRIIEALNTVFNKMFPYYYAEPGVASDLDGLYYTAKTYGKLYASLLEWSIDALSLVVEDEYIKSRSILAQLADEAILQTEEFPLKCLKQMESVEKQLSKGETVEVVEAKLTISINSKISEQNTEELSNLLELVKRGIIQ